VATQRRTPPAVTSPPRSRIFKTARSPWRPRAFFTRGPGQPTSKRDPTVAALLRFHPAIHQFLQNIERDGAVGEHDFMELPNIELISKFLLRLLTQLQNFDHADLVGRRLTWHDDVTID
jgi:hypothetical protein